jgi:predicted nucleotidyltransferase
MQIEANIKKLYEEALESFVDKVKKDRNIIAAILYGSLSYDEVWEKSDIDVWLIAREGKKGEESYCLVENGVNIHVAIIPRSQFKRGLEKALQSSMIHSSFSKSKLLFSSDETINEWYQNVNHLGARDKEIQLLRAATWVLPSLTKAEKWFYVKKDLDYSFLWIMYSINGLATIETLMNDEVTGRDVIHQALKYNPSFFNAIYTDLINQKKDEKVIQKAIQMINDYLDDKIFLFKPILDFLTDAGGMRTTTELDEYFKKKAQIDSLDFAYEWLADKGIIQKVSSPLRLTIKSRVEVEEAAYYYDGGGL